MRFGQLRNRLFGCLRRNALRLLHVPYLEVLIGNKLSKTRWRMHKQQEIAARGGNRHFLVVGSEMPMSLGDVVRDHVIEHLGNADGEVVIDQAGFLKKDQASCSVGRQYKDSGGKITNCQMEGSKKPWLVRLARDFRVLVC